MAISSDAQWRTSPDPAELAARVEGTLTDGERLMILSGFARPIWTHTPMVQLGVSPIMNRLELAAYGEVEYEAVFGSAELLQGFVNDFGEDRMRHTPEGMSLRLCHEVAQWAVRRDGFSETVATLADVLRRLALWRPAPPPDYVAQPHELPWQVFVHLEGGIDGKPSIWKQTLTNCNRLMADVIREVLPSPYTQVAVEQHWLDEEMVHSAFTMFHTSNFDSIGQLGERLEDRGGADTDILLHCMDQRHIRGCWLVDEITGQRHRLRCF
jgi:hypothetical protein